MRQSHLTGIAVVFLLLFSHVAMAANGSGDPCTVEDADDDLGNSSTLRWVVQEFLNDRSDKPCSAAGYEDGEYFGQAVYFLTDEANTSSVPDVNLIHLDDPLEFNMQYTAVIGNVSQDALDDVETDKALDVAYDTDGNKSNDGDSYTMSGGEVKDYGMIVIDGRDLGSNVSPFSCVSGSESVYLRNMIVLTDGVTTDEVFSASCVKDGGNAWVCAYDYKDGSDPRTDSDWCTGGGRDWGITPIDPGSLGALLKTYYADTDGDGYGDLNSSQRAFSQPDGYVTNSDDCDDTDAAINPDATEVCDGIDNNCDGRVDPLWCGGIRPILAIKWYRDADGDGYGDPEDKIVQFPWSDDYGVQPDGYVANDDDCDDTDATLTTDCPGSETTWYRDADGDGYGDAADSLSSVEQPDGYVANADDCDDTDATLTTDCPGTETTWYRDADGDGFGDAADSMDSVTQPDDYVDNDDDCDDSDATLTTDCSGETQVWYRDADGDGFGDASSTTTAVDQHDGYVENGYDCDDTDASLNIGCCDDSRVWYIDADGDGYGSWFDTVTAVEQPTGYVDNAGDCDDEDTSRTTSCPETSVSAGSSGEGMGDDPEGECSDGIDNDADGATDCADSFCSLLQVCADETPEVTPDTSEGEGDAGSGSTFSLQGDSIGGCSLAFDSGAASNFGNQISIVLAFCGLLAICVTRRAA